MKVKLTSYRWDDALRDHVPIPLDDAEPEIIQLARLVHGKEVTQRQLKTAMKKVGLID